MDVLKEANGAEAQADASNFPNHMLHLRDDGQLADPAVNELTLSTRHLDDDLSHGIVGASGGVHGEPVIAVPESPTKVKFMELKRPVHNLTNPFDDLEQGVDTADTGAGVGGRVGALVGDSLDDASEFGSDGCWDEMAVVGVIVEDALQLSPERVLLVPVVDYGGAAANVVEDLNFTHAEREAVHSRHLNQIHVEGRQVNAGRDGEVSGHGVNHDGKGPVTKGVVLETPLGLFEIDISQIASEARGRTVDRRARIVTTVSADKLWLGEVEGSATGGSVLSVDRVLLGNVQRRATRGAAVASVAIVGMGSRLGRSLRFVDGTETRQACFAIFGWGRS